MTQEEIIELFENEFAPVERKFEVIKVLNGQKFLYHNIKNAEYEFDGKNIIWHPGVYVFWGNGRVWRVGRHFTNARMRVLQHINANIQSKDGKYKIRDLEGINDAEVILFVLKKNIKENLHWIAALEVFFENRLGPEACIPPNKIG